MPKTDNTGYQRVLQKDREYYADLLAAIQRLRKAGGGDDLTEVLKFAERKARDEVRKVAEELAGLASK